MRTLVLFFLLFVKVSFLSAQESPQEISGDILQFALPATALASTYFYQSDDQPYWQFLKAYSLSIATTHILKRLINKPRPNGGKYSFPSGHTTSAFSGAAFLQRRYGWKIGIPAYLLASYVGYTRIKARKHDIYDVMAGATIGVVGSLLFAKPYKNKDLTLQLFKTDRFYLVGFHYSF